MPDQPSAVPLTQPTDLRKDLERISAENLVLRQQMEFQRLFAEEREKQAIAFKEHKGSVDSEINKRMVGMSLLGLLVAGLAWWSTITPIRKNVTERLDHE